MRSITKKQVARPILCAGLVVLALAGIGASPLAQRSSSPAPRRQTFDVVSVRRNLTNDVGSNIIDRPDGGFTMLNVPTTALLARAYAPALVADMINLPRWSMTERYDVSATSKIPNPTAAQRQEMLQALLGDRFKLAVHTENRDQPAYDLVLARADRRLGPDIKPSALDCDPRPLAGRATAAPRGGRGGAPARGPLPASAPSSPCALTVNAGSVEGDTTMAQLTNMLRPSAGRPIVDKTGLKGSYHIMMMPDASAPGSPALPPMLASLESRLGLKLVPSMTKGEVIVIDRIERPGS
jgi:uncharacterized protein (TIGR03435 family)